MFGPSDPTYKREREVHASYVVLQLRCRFITRFIRHMSRCLQRHLGARLPHSGPSGLKIGRWLEQDASDKAKSRSRRRVNDPTWRQLEQGRGGLGSSQQEAYALGWILFG